MTKLQKVSLYAFCAFVVLAIALSYLMGATLFADRDKPWHMLPFIDADSLTVEYTDNYRQIDKRNLYGKFADSSRLTVSILVDAWGVPFVSQLLREDFSAFDGLPHKEFLHYRLANRTRHAEFAELRIVADSSAPQNGIYLFGGDSLEYGRNLYVDSLGYAERVFCQRCADSLMLGKLDSVLSLATDSLPLQIALTTQDSRTGNRAKLHATLRLIAEVAKKYPKVQFIVQGTHRPTLGAPKIRRESFAHWVPAIVLN